MKKLLKSHGFNSDMQYYQMIADSFINVQISQAHNQFGALPKPYRMEFLKAATVGAWQSGISDRQLTALFDRALDKVN